MTIFRARWMAAASVSALAIGSGPAAEAVEIGSVAAANPAIDGTPPETNASRRLNLGDTVISNERIVTSDAGSGQLIFLDQTALIVSPASDIVLDRYVYDPDAGAGEIALTLSKGVMRFIGGRITKSAEATIKTPHATIGLRGAIAAFTVDESGTKATLIAGETLKITGKTGTLTLSRNNASAEVPADEGEPQYSGLADLTEIASLYGTGESAGGGTTESFTSGEVSGAATSSGLGETGATSPGATTAAPISTLGEQPSETTSEEPMQVRESAETAIAEDPEVIGGGGGGGGPAPIVGLNGLAFVAPTGGFTTIFGSEISDPNASGNIFSPEGPINFEAIFAGSRLGVTEGGDEYLIPTPAATGFYTFGGLFEAPDVPADGSTPLGPISGQGFYDVEEDFLLAAFSTLSPEPRLGMTMMGIATPGQLDTTFGEEITARRYEIGPDFITGLETALPPIFDYELNSAQDDFLYFIPGPEQRFLGDDRTEIGFAGDSRARSMFGSIAIDGEGPGQSSLLITHSGDLVPNEIYAPTISDTFRTFFNLGDGDIAGFGFIDVGTIADPEGNTVFGSDGQYLAFGNAGQFYDGDNDPGLEYSASFYLYFDRSILTEDVIREEETEGQVEGVYGTLRGASLQGEEFIGGYSARTPIAPAIETVFPETVGTFTNGFSGGYAAGQAQSRIVTAPEIEDVLPPPYVLRSESGESVRVAFNTFTNSVAVEFDGLNSVGEGGRSGLTVSFGGDSGLSALLDDNRFTADARRPKSTGDITGQETEFDGSAGAEGGAFNGAITTAGLAGDGGIFPAGVDTSPEYLRWGWWAGDYRFSSDPEEGEKQFGRDMIPLGTWVAGDRTALADLDTDGVATFDGLAVAHIAEVGGEAGLTASYVEGGRYQMVFNFGERTGNATITGIAESVFTASVSEAGAGPGNHFGGTLMNGPESAVGSISGSFFSGGGDPTAATAGSFGFEQPGALGSTVTGAGIFAADKVVLIE